MNKIHKLLIAAGTVATAMLGLSASAAIVSVPSYSDVVSSTSTSFAQSLFTDLLPWAAVFVAIVIGTLALKALMGRVTGGAKRLFGGGRRGRGRRRK